jgi:hypothetical protein
MRAGRAKAFNSGHIAADKVGDSASAIGKSVFFFDHGYFGGSLTRQATLEPERNSADHQYVESHFD